MTFINNSMSAVSEGEVKICYIPVAVLALLVCRYICVCSSQSQLSAKGN